MTIASLLPVKRGVSPIIGYVMLIVLALSLAGTVYVYLSRYAPDNSEKCPSDVTLAIQEAKCSEGKLNITLVNRGLFSADGAFIRIGGVGQAAKESLTDCTPSRCYLYFNRDRSQGNRYSRGLTPGDTKEYSLEYDGLGSKEIEIQPLVFASGNVTRELLCTSIVKQPITCTS